MLEGFDESNCDEGSTLHQDAMTFAHTHYEGMQVHDLLYISDMFFHA